MKTSALLVVSATALTIYGLVAFAESHTIVNMAYTVAGLILGALSVGYYHEEVT